MIISKSNPVVIDQTLSNEIVALLKWDELRYEKFVLECGNAYLYAYIKGEAEEVIQQIKKSRSFWNWWKRNWEARDMAFAESITKPISVAIARQLYQDLHCPATLASELHPDGEALGESYATMIEELNREVMS